MKNILKIQIAAVTILSLFFGVLGFVMVAEPAAANNPPLPAAAEAVPLKILSVLARPADPSVLPKGEFSLQGADAAGLLPAQSPRLQIGSGYAESLQGAAHATSIPNQVVAPAFALRVAPVYLAVRMSSAESPPSHIWVSGSALPGFPAASQALVPALALAFFFIRTRTGRPRVESGGLSGQGTLVLTGFFQTNKVLRC